MVPLHYVKEGVVVRIAQINSGRGMMSRLNNMGLFIGQKLQVVRNSHGHIIVAQDNLRLALGRGMSSRIMVEEEGV